MFVGLIALWVFIHTLAITKKDVCNAYLTEKRWALHDFGIYSSCASFWKNEKKKKNMNRKKVAYFVIFASLILLVFNLSEFNFNNLKENHYAGIASNLLLILAMIVTIRELNKSQKK